MDVVNVKPLPTPRDLWGDYNIKSWEPSYNKWFEIWLNSLASMIIYSEQNTINRVNSLVIKTIKEAREEILEPIQAISSIRPLDVFTKEELGIIKLNMKTIGPYLTLSL